MPVIATGIYPHMLITMANHVQRRHRPVCHTWLATIQCIIVLGG